MSEPEKPTKQHRRSARTVLGSLATGAMLGTAAVAGAAPASAAAAAAPDSLHEQFDQAFTPGAVDLYGGDDPDSIVVYAS